MAPVIPSLWLTFRALLWAVILPGIVAFYVPWRYFGLASLTINAGEPVQLLGLLMLIPGAVLLMLCIYEFARWGRGTLSPLDPPRVLVVRGLYRWVRNPMYLSVALIVFGEVLLARSTALLVYWAMWFLAVNIFVIAYEEPALARQFGPSYEAYVKTVGRWIPRLPSAWRAAEPVVPFVGAETICALCGAADETGYGVRIQVFDSSRRAEMMVHRSCVAALLPHQALSAPGNLRRVPRDAACGVCGRRLPVIGRHPYGVTLSDPGPSFPPGPRRWFVHAECFPESLRVLLPPPPHH